MRHPRTVLASLILATPGIAAAASQPWAFVESVGGITVGDPVQAGGAWSLPVNADVSGLVAFSTKPSTLNSGLACSSVVAKIIDNEIYLTLNSDLAGGTKSARCPAAQLGALKAGTYAVYYRGPQDNPVFLRSVSVGL